MISEPKFQFEVSLNPTGENRSTVRLIAHHITMNHPTGKVRFREDDGRIVCEFNTSDVGGINMYPVEVVPSVRDDALVASS